MYSIGVGLADSYSTITKFDNPEGALNNYYEGKRIGEIWGYVTDGFIQDEAEAQRMATIQGDISKIWMEWKVLHLPRLSIIQVTRK